MAKDSQVQKSRFVVIYDGDVDTVENTLPEAVNYVNSSYDVDDADGITILEFVKVYKLIPDKVSETEEQLSSYEG